MKKLIWLGNSSKKGCNSILLIRVPSLMSAADVWRFIILLFYKRFCRAFAAIKQQNLITACRQIAYIYRALRVGKVLRF